ncbi:hypothetical protein LSTR_LSTR004509 [Laodelphax striatellus]|uniref:Odorant receptor n=1 Tax=Laodelphax striatellus TaxID=195883 RepID=A0A482XGW4_LAOST|nr:hypothetical protein LSTR_LSTR004509 [Laodelphax striatellus]
MIGENFNRIFNTFYHLSLISGNCVPGLSKSSRSFGTLLLIYCVVIILICASQIVACVVVLSDYTHNTNFIHTASILNLYLGLMFWNIYLLYKREHFYKIIDRIDYLIDNFNADKETGVNEFEMKVKIDFETLNKITTVGCLSMSLLPVINNTQKLIRGWKWFGMDGVRVFNYQVPYFAQLSPIYELTIFLQASSLFWVCSEQCCIIYLFSIFFFLITHFFEHLHQVIGSVLEEEGDQLCSMGLKHWIKLHQEVLSVTEDIIDLYSPMLCVYFLYIYSTVAFTIYSALQNTHSHTVVEVMVLVYFTLMTLTNFYILCHYGNKIKEQSENTIRAVFAAPWYDCTHFQKTLLKMVILRSQKAIVVTSFNSSVFDLTNSTFIVIMKSIVSFYLGLVKMRQQAEISSEM